MTYRVTLSPGARTQLEEIVVWLLENRGDAATVSFSDDYEKCVETLEEMPLFRPLHDTLPYRHAAVGRYGHTLWYQVVDDQVFIRGFAHARMSLSTIRERMDDDG